jgi:FkbM family methyltransferase
VFILKFLSPTLFFKVIQLFWRVDSPFRLMLCCLFGRPDVFYFKSKSMNVRLFLRSRGDVAIVFEVFFLDVYPVSELCKGKVGIDFGGHIGVFSIFCLLNLGLEKMVIVEPVRENVESLRKNLLLNSLEARATVVAAGVGPSDGRSEINISSSTNSHSLVFTESSFSKESIRLATYESICIESKQADFDLVKIDIEGFEYSVMNELLQAISRAVLVYFERHDLPNHSFANEVLDKIVASGHRVISIQTPGPVYFFVNEINR